MSARLPDSTGKDKMTPAQSLSRKESILQDLRQIKARGVGLGNVNEAFAVIINTLIFLVENTEEKKK